MIFQTRCFLWKIQEFFSYNILTFTPENQINCNILTIFINTCKSFYVNLVKFLEYFFVGHLRTAKVSWSTFFPKEHIFEWEYMPHPSTPVTLFSVQIIRRIRCVLMCPVIIMIISLFNVDTKNKVKNYIN